MTADKEATNTNYRPSAISSQPSALSRVRRWLSIGLIVVGFLLLGAGGVMAYLNSVTLAEPPPPVGAVELPPSLEENPLPVVTDDDWLASAASYATSTPTPTASPSISLSDTRQDVQDVSIGPRPSLTPTSIPPAASPPTRIVIPAVNLDADVVPIGWKQVTQGGQTASVWEVAEYAAGWHQDSALPGGGGNIVLSGHHNIKGEVFRYIVDLEPGDAVILYADDRPYTYTVESRFVVKDKGESEEKRRENARWIGSFPDERVTLVTCWPYTSNSHRVIVIARPTG